VNQYIRSVQLVIVFCSEVAELAVDNSAEYSSDVLWLKANRRNPLTEKDIFDRMRRTFPGRRQYITGGGDQASPPTTNEVLETFPRFLDTEGLVLVYLLLLRVGM